MQTVDILNKLVLSYHRTGANGVFEAIVTHLRPHVNVAKYIASSAQSS